jgi:hypothetical protein
MNSEEPRENPVSATEPQAAEGVAKGPESPERPRHRGGRRGRFRRGGRGGGRDRRPEREERPDGEHRGEEAAGAAPAEEGRKQSTSSIRKATDQVLHVRGELRRVLDEIQDILRTLDQAEREKTASEDEIEMLRDSLRGLHREPSYPRHRGGSSSPKPASPPAPVQEEAEKAEEADDEEEDEPEEED